MTRFSISVLIIYVSTFQIKYINYDKDIDDTLVFRSNKKTNLVCISLTFTTSRALLVVIAHCYVKSVVSPTSTLPSRPKIPSLKNSNQIPGEPLLHGLLPGHRVSKSSNPTRALMRVPRATTQYSYKDHLKFFKL